MGVTSTQKCVFSFNKSVLSTYYMLDYLDAKESKTDKIPAFVELYPVKGARQKADKQIRV